MVLRQTSSMQLAGGQLPVWYVLDQKSYFSDLLHSFLMLLPMLARDRFRPGFFHPTHAELPHPAPVLELAEGRLDRLAAQTERRTTFVRAEQRLHRQLAGGRRTGQGQ
jgi:hypothetical protein